MSENTDTNTFTQRDLLHHLLQAAQHSVTREEMASQFARAERLSLERFEQVDKRFEQVDKKFDEIKLEIREQGKKHDRLSWAIFSGMLAILFKDVIVKAIGI